jgi:hypothetical protein
VCHATDYVCHLYLVSFFFWWGTYRADMLHDIIHSCCIKKRTLKTERNLNIDINSMSYLENPINFDPSCSFIRYRNSEFPLSLESLWDFLWLQYSEFPQILLQLRSNPEVEKLRHSVQIRSSSGHWQLSETINPELLVQLWYTSKHQKVSYKVDIGSSLRLHSIGSEKFRFRGIPDSVQNRISAAQST